MMHDDEDLRARFKAQANAESTAAPALSPEIVDAARCIGHARTVRRSPARRVAAIAASIVVALVTLGVGLVFGTSTGYASARVEGERERSAIATSTIGVTRQLNSLRGDLASMRIDLMRLAAKGTVAHTTLLAAEAEVDSMSANIARIEANLNASSDASIRRPALAILRGIPVGGALSALSCGAVPAVAPPARLAQGGIPLITLPAATVKVAQPFGAILGIRQAPDGKILVNDALRRQLVLFDSSLTTPTIVRDSAPGSANSYGPRPTPLIPYLGDSSLLADWNARTMMVLDAHGQVARALALVKPADLWPMNSSYSGVDSRGRLLFRGLRTGAPHTRTPDITYRDSVPLLREDLEQRRIDTVGFVARPVMKIVTEKSSDGKTSRIYAADPLQPVDDWAVLSTGAVALVRGHDYHIDWLLNDDQMMSTGKLPFPWKHLTDEDKARLADSVRTAQSMLLANGYPQAEIWLRSPCDAPTPGAGSGGGGGRAGASGTSSSSANDHPDCTMIYRNGNEAPVGSGTPPALPALLDLVRSGPIADYLPPINQSATMPDADGNLWILPRVSTLSQRGELVYDIVNGKGVLVERVRLPLGRAIAGFGKGGVVYLTSGDKTNGYYLERTKLPATARAAK